jgi:alanine racemase
MIEIRERCAAGDAPQALSNPCGNSGAENRAFLDLEEVISILKPLRVCGPGTGPVSGVAIDTRKPIGEDHIYWAIRGKHFNGADFARDALRLGAKAVVTDRSDLFDDSLGGDKTVVQVPDTLMALQHLASVYRKRFAYPVVAVTGSNGKTLVKEMLASILCREKKTYRSPLSYNTQVGAALSLLGLRGDRDVAVIEAGISLPGEMDRLAEMIRPDHGILTVISKAHIGGLGSLERIAEQKMRLFRELEKNSFLVVNADDPLSLSQVKNLECRVVTFGFSDSADFRGERLEYFAGEGYRFRICMQGVSHEAMLHVAGRFNVLNALAASAAASMLGVGADAITRGLAEFRPSPMRLEMHTTVSGVTLLNDTYNSDPASMKGALDALAKLGKGRRKIAILSEMLDLGLHSREEHLEVGRDVVRAKVDHLITVGENAALIGQGAVAGGMSSSRVTNTHTFGEAAQELEKILSGGDMVLFKGSRWFRLDKIARDLVGSIGPTRLIVNLDAIAENIKTIRAIVGEGVSIIAVVKSFGYGNDSIRTSKVALENGVNYLAVAFPDEGVTLRQNRIDAPILVFNVLEEEIDKIVRHQLSAVLSSEPLARALNRAAAVKGQKIRVHVKVDTGMGRSGVWHEEAIPFFEYIRELPHLELEGVMTHLSSADDPEADAYTVEQLRAFENLLGALRSRDFSFTHIHAANSSGLVRFPESRFNAVRPGLAIYGMYPSDAVKEKLRLRQVITFITRISQIKTHPPGRCISYNRRYVTRNECRIATLPVGYNDGYPRFQSNKGHVLVRGRRVPVVGTVCMDNTMIDVSSVPEADVGDEVVLIGRQGEQEILADEIALNGGTINYEIACKISPRVTRIFLQS